MKTMRKCGKYAAPVLALLITAVLVIGCIAPLDGFFPTRPAVEEGDDPIPAGGPVLAEEWEQVQLSEGMGVLRLVIDNGSNARAILPTQLPDGTYYYLKFTAATDLTAPVGGDAERWIAMTGATTTAAITLNIGGYTAVDVYAVTDNLLDEDFAYAHGSFTGTITVTDGVAPQITPNPITINNMALITPDAGTEDGTFTWAIDYTNASSVTAATVAVAVRSGTNAALPTPATWSVFGAGTPTTGASGSVGIKPGYYLLTFTFSKGANNISFQQILHVYQNMESVFSYDGLTDSYFPAGGTGTGQITITAPDVPTDPGLTVAYTPTNGGTLLNNVLTLATGEDGTLTVSGGTGPYAWTVNGAAVTTGNTLAISFGDAPFDTPDIEDYVVTILDTVGNGDALFTIRMAP